MLSRLNRALNRVSNTVNKLVNAVASGITQLQRAGQRDVNRGADIFRKQAELDQALETIQTELDTAYETVSQKIEQEEEDFVLDVEEFEERPEWVDRAEEEYPDVLFDLGGPSNCPDGKAHNSAIYGSIEEIVYDWRNVPVIWWIASDDNGNSFYAVTCDASGQKRKVQPTIAGGDDKLEGDDV